MKMNSSKLILNSIIVLLITLLFVQCKQKDNKEASSDIIDQPIVLSTEAQLYQIMDWWPGTYNNDTQIDAVIKQGKDVWRIDDSGENGYLQLQSHYVKIDKPDIGSHVLYVEEYRDHVPTETYRQRIYTLSIDSSDMIKVKMWPFKNKTKYIGAWNDLSMLNDLTQDSITAFPDICDLHVSKMGDEYHMIMNGDDCAFGERVFNYQVELTEDMFRYRDKITNKTDKSIITTAADFVFHDLDRIK